MERRRVAALAGAATGLLILGAGLATSLDATQLGPLDPAIALESLRPVLQVALAVGWAVPGIALARRRPELPFWWLALVAGASHAAAAGLVAMAPGRPWAVWAASWLIVVELPVLAAIVQLFPDGRTLPGWRPYLVASLGAGLLGLVAAAIDALPEASGALVDGAGVATVPLFAFAALGGAVPVAVRRHRAEGAERRALGWLLVVMAGGLIVPGLVAAGGRSGEVAAQIFTVVQIGFVSAAVLRHRVWGMVPMTRGSLVRAMAATDGERRRIRAELHDGVGAGLTAVRLKVDAAHHLVTSRPERAAEMLDSASSDLGAVLDDVRAIVEGLRPAVLDRLRLSDALQQRADEISAHAEGLTVTLTGGAHLDALGGGADVVVYRVVTEALTNVVRHSHAARCEIIVQAHGDDVAVDVIDDGPVTETASPNGVGLSSMADRAAEVGGYVLAHAEPNGGYRVHLVIPSVTDTEHPAP